MGTKPLLLYLRTKLWPTIMTVGAIKYERTIQVSFSTITCKDDVPLSEVSLVESSFDGG